MGQEWIVMTDNGRKHPAGRRRARGAGLIEVLIAVLILSVGLLGMLAMQTTAKRTAHEAAQRSLATAMAREILERMRSNPSALGSYVATLGGGSIATAPASCVTGSCDSTQMASRDLYELEQMLDGAAEKGSDATNVGGLVAPTACITNASGVVVVAIAWKGVAELRNSTASTCGNGLGLYGTGEVLRRLVVLSTFIADV